jgi:hypothetical protein
MILIKIQSKNDSIAIFENLRLTRNSHHLLIRKLGLKLEESWIC